MELPLPVERAAHARMVRMLHGQAALKVSGETYSTYPGAWRFEPLEGSPLLGALLLALTQGQYNCFLLCLYNMASGVISGHSFTAIFHT